MPDLDDYDEMFPDRVTIKDGATEIATGVMCMIHTLSGRDIVAMSSQNPMVETKVYFQADRSDLRPAMTLLITTKAGATPDRTIGLRVVSTAREKIGDFLSCWADCSGRA